MSKCNCEGDSNWGCAAMILAVGILIFLFSGEPDITDSLIHYLNK